jgi:NAD+ kinase
VRILIIPRSGNERAAVLARELAAWADAHGHETVLLPPDAEACAMAERAVGEADLGTPELIVALGGDGTILRAAHVLRDGTAPILGINLGRLGFLAGADEHEAIDAVEAALAGRTLVEPKLELEAVVASQDTEIGRFRALNEVHVGRTERGRVAELAVAVNGTELMRFMCDGVLVATPAGSTAYALSVGGPIVAPEVRGAILVPVAPHTLAARAFVTGPDDVIEVTCPDPARAEACVVVDGASIMCPGAIERVSVRLRPGAVRILRLHGRDFYDVVRRKFLGG